MQIRFIQTGKTHFDFIDAGFEEYAKRIRRYGKFSFHALALPSKMKSDDQQLIKKMEADLQLKELGKDEFAILLDEKGKRYDSVTFAVYLQKLMNHETSIAFLTGGAYGFAEEIYQRADAKLSLSDFTFSHQLVKLIFAEQLYRAFTIIRGEPYHHA